MWRTEDPNFKFLYKTELGYNINLYLAENLYSPKDVENRGSNFMFLYKTELGYNIKLYLAGNLYSPKDVENRGSKFQVPV